jgi:hypothetical protein
MPLLREVYQSMKGARQTTMIITFRQSNKNLLQYHLACMGQAGEETLYTFLTYTVKKL